MRSEERRGGEGGGGWGGAGCLKKKKEGRGDGIVSGVQTCALPISDRVGNIRFSAAVRAYNRGDAGLKFNEIGRAAGWGRGGGVGGGGVFKKKKRGKRRWNCEWSSDVCSSDLGSRRKYSIFRSRSGLQSR